ncbi:hypothetical protein GNX71_05955 [Variovorax sp. RKNM96]|uniref:hypothetical protein n=1 Tax=Variovorax sp. RKNM96 TaxID=2681552 RepID=UPI00197FEE9F|nr:hypothetical protein [Variovorax sp. RKNM96]QSI29143.1 hypothetical protein GNX71_05955 [Variovorax sp. RKNM96]
MAIADATRRLPSLAKPTVLDAGTAAAVVLVPLNPRGICETDALRIGRQLWLVTQWHGAGLPQGVWRPVRMIRVDDFQVRPMGDRLVLVEPMATRLFKGKATFPGHEVLLHPDILVDFGSSTPVTEAAARRRRRVASNK